MSATATWYYATGSDPVGPYSVAQMNTLLAAGVVKVETLVWSVGMADWTPYYQSTLTREPARVATLAMPHVRADSGAEPAGFLDTLGDAIGTCFSKFALFDGRASRAECWFFALFSIVTALLLAGLDMVILGRDFPVVAMVFALLVLTPSVSVLVRRLHDTGRSGWWALLGMLPLLGNLALLVLCSMRGTDGQNRFG